MPSGRKRVRDEEHPLSALIAQQQGRTARPRTELLLPPPAAPAPSTMLLSPSAAAPPFMRLQPRQQCDYMKRNEQQCTLNGIHDGRCNNHRECKEVGCNKTAAGSTDFCKAHGGGRPR